MLHILNTFKEIFLEQLGQILEKLVELKSADSNYPTQLLCCE